MFNQKEKEMYRSIKAPDDLKNRILSSDLTSEKNKFMHHSILGFVACVCLIAGIYLFTNHTSTTISMNGHVISHQPVEVTFAPSLSRTNDDSSLTVHLTFQLNESYQISCSDGMIQPEIDELEKGKTELTWIIQSPQIKPYYMFLETDTTKKQLKLSFDNDKQTWTIVQESN